MQAPTASKRIAEITDVIIIPFINLASLFRIGKNHNNVGFHHTAAGNILNKVDLVRRDWLFLGERQVDKGTGREGLQLFDDLLFKI